MPIEDMDLTVRSYNCLKREGVHTVGELVTRSEADLLDIRNFGAKSIDEVKMKLAAMGLALKDSPPGFIPTSIESYDEGYETDAYQGTRRVRRRRVQRRLLPGDRAALRLRAPDGGVTRRPASAGLRPATLDGRTTAPHDFSTHHGRSRARTARPPEEGPTCPPPPRAPVSAGPPRTSG